eukprot:CAMPEP_0174714200 /NCGR_PEP_ID=MMETSP1094-20130205/17111_1 /TAXON_ID=156173 /ORGANISM="Chrysochromulina brevifilum, Strain UTEX LB 985" /LENGTH=132 /DNA_ID=CAMNT_0015913505 /DNA_START=79 /DNA_END=478 /DNA_ORIENTATION=+
MEPEPDERQTRELQAFMETENQKAVIQAAISKLTETCFDKCVTKPGTKLDSSEANCIANCAGRYLDSSVFVVNRMMANGSSSSEAACRRAWQRCARLAHLTSYAVRWFVRLCRHGVLRASDDEPTLGQCTSA